MGGSIRGTVVRGAGEGRQFGYPTANLALPSDTQRPPAGVYACWVWRAGHKYPGALVSGVAWDGPSLPRLEVYLIGLNHDMYGEILEVEVVKKIRDIEQFQDTVALQARIAQDIAAIRTLLGVS